MSRPCNCDPGQWCVECIFWDGVDDEPGPDIPDPDKCPDCKGAGGLILFNFWHDCDTCGGSGY